MDWSTVNDGIEEKTDQFRKKATQVSMMSQVYERIPRDVLDALLILSSRFKAYLVGGCVRDLLLGSNPEDYDIATNVRPQQVLELFRELGWITVPKGIEYGVVSVVHPQTRREIEIATFRKEFYARDFDRRSAVVEFSDDLRDDVVRRDFTVNALAMDVHGNVVDYVGGLRDLEDGIIRFVGNPLERIREDPLRMLRAIRLAAKLGFKIEPRTLNAIQQNAELLRYVSWERIGEEIRKAAKTPRFAMFVKLLYESKLYRYAMPELEDMARCRHPSDGSPHRGETVLEHTINVIEQLDRWKADWVTKIAALLHDVGKPRCAQIIGGKLVFWRHEVVGAEIAEISLGDGGIATIS